jgi:hypothetical protein
MDSLLSIRKAILGLITSSNELVTIGWNIANSKRSIPIILRESRVALFTPDIGGFVLLYE